MNTHRRARYLRSTAACAVAVLQLISQLSAVTGGPNFPDPGNPGMSRADQIALGKQAAAQVYKQMPVLPDNSPETQYIRQVGEKLVATIPSQYSWPFEFHVIPQKEVNAFALPGGPMFINLGTITAAKNEAELAGVMAHEMSHVYMQHSAKQAVKNQKIGLLAGLAGAVLGATTGGFVGQLSQMGVQFGTGLITQKFSRDDESQADAVGAIILYKAGYNPQAMADFFKTLETEGGGAPPQLLSDHPNPGNREHAIENEIRAWPPKQYQTNSAAFQKAKAHAESVKAYTAEEIAAGAKSGEWAAMNKRNGAVFNSGGDGSVVNSSLPPNATSETVLPSVLPSQRAVAADLGPMKVSHPDNWQVTLPRQKGESVTIAPEQGVTASGVGYGVIISAVGAPQGKRMSIDQLTSELVNDLQQNNGVKAIGSPQAVTVGGVQGRSVMMQSVSPFPSSDGKQQEERDWLVTVPRSNNTVIYFVFVAPQAQFERFRPTFESMLRSVQF